MVNAESHDRILDTACRSRASTPSGRVVVAMSGGVDSSVVAGLLKRQGRDVIGITLQLYDHGEATGKAGSCCAGQDIHDARRVAEHLGIPHYVLDYERRFESAVMASFADSYLAGETPIPCVTCNQQIKFRDLLETAADLGAETLATGHYIERRDGVGGPALHRAVDADRDQSYFLFATTPAQLARLEFPLGGLAKREVRRLAGELGLPVADKADSQDICFVPSGRYTDVIERLKPGAIEPGEIVDLQGQVLGRHNGIVNYTIGQRRGLGITGPSPLFVVKLDPARRQVVVGPREALASRRLVLRNVNWLGAEPLERIGRAGIAVSARVRSTQAPQPARLWVDGDGTALVDLMDGGEVGVAPGQACVLYDSEEPRAQMLGGGFIARALPAVMAEAAGRRADPMAGSAP